MCKSAKTNAPASSLRSPNVELVSVASGAVYVDAVRVMHIAGRIDKTGERSVEIDHHLQSRGK